MLIKLTNTNKRSNSTKIIGDGYAEYHCSLKENCTLSDPIVILHYSSPGFVPAFNYAHFPAFSRYYFIDSWEWIGGRWIASMHCDVLASFRSQILDQSLYITRAASAYNPDLIDMLYPAEAGYTEAVSGSSSPFFKEGAARNPGDGVYIVGVINQRSTAGITSYYAIKPGDMNTLNNQLISVIDSASISGVSDSIAKSMVSPLDYITSVHWYPMNPVDIEWGEVVHSIPLAGYGSLTVDAEYMRPSTWISEHSYSITVPKHPQASAALSYLKASPYSRYTLFIPPFGSFDIDTNAVYNEASVIVSYNLDLTTGLAYGRVTAGSRILFDISGMVAVPIPFGQVTQNVLGAAGGVLSAITGAIAGSASAAVSGVASAVDNMLPHVQTKGGEGSWSQLALPWCIRGEYLTQAERNNSDQGYPLMQVKKLSALSGYAVAESADIQISGALDPERNAIRQHLTAGVFLE